MTLYVVDEKHRLSGAIDLKKLITARENDNLHDIIICSYPYVTEHEKVEDCMERIVAYAEDSIPVLNEDKILLGVITSEDMIEMVDNELGEDYARLAGLTEEEDLTETTVQSMKKRLPWLIALLFLGMLVSSVAGIFEGVVAMVVSSIVGTLIPMFFHKIKIDPAVASGPLITTVNDLVAVVTYYGLAYVFLVR